MPDIFTSSSINNNPTESNKSEKSSFIHKIATEIRPKNSIGLFSHYCPNPAGVSFVNQENNEHIVLFLRKHFITNVPWILSTALLLILPIFVIAIFLYANFSLFSISPNIIFILLVFYLLIVLNMALVNFVVWFYHVGIVTQKRLLDLDVYNILNHHLAETNVTEIVDVSYSQQGFAQSFFNYGNIPIQTEAIKANFEFELAPKPATVSDIITDLRAEIRGRA